MLNLTIPGGSTYLFEHLVLDFNGTIGFDGELIVGVRELLVTLDEKLSLHILTADTHGTVAQKLNGLPVALQIIEDGRQDLGKYEFIKGLGSDSVVAMGNGRNDVMMLQEAALGIAVIQKEGCAGILLASADIVCTSISDALQLLIYPTRLQATLRN